MNVREADGADKIAAYERASAIFGKLKASTKGIHKLFDQDSAVNYLFDGPGVKSFIVDETYLVSYTFTEPWATTGQPVVYELVMARLYDNGGSFAHVLDFLMQEARTFMCAGVIVGTALTKDDRPLARVLSAAGFTPLSWEHFKPTE